MNFLDHSHGIHEGHIHEHLESFAGILEHSFIETLPMIPILIITFILIEYMEHRFSNNLQNKIRNSGILGPFLGAVIGIIPQCGFSIMAVALYSRKIVSLGTMMAIFIATSDEALPIILSTPKSYDILVPFILVKVIMAVAFGYLIDLLIAGRFRNIEVASTKEVEEKASVCIENDSISFKKVLVHSLERTFKVTIYIFLITFGISLLVEYVGVTRLADGFFGSGISQVFLASVIGLIPNCAVSVAIIQLYTMNVICFGSVIAGLSSNAGLGLVFLFKESKDKKKALWITGILLLISFLSGLIIYLSGFMA